MPLRVLLPSGDYDVEDEHTLPEDGRVRGGLGFSLAVCFLLEVAIVIAVLMWVWRKG